MMKKLFIILQSMILIGCSSDQIEILIDNQGEIHQEYCSFFSRQLHLDDVELTVDEKSQQINIKGHTTNTTSIDTPNAYLFIKVHYTNGWRKGNYAVKFINLETEIGRNDTSMFNTDIDVPQIKDNQQASNIYKIELSSFYSLTYQELKETFQ